MYNKASENLGFMEFGSEAGDQALNNVVGYNLLINNGHVFWINTNNGYGVDVRNLQFFNNNVVETHAPRLPDVKNLIGIASTPYNANVLTMKNNIFWINTAANITDPNLQPFNGPQLIHQSNLYHLSGGNMGFNMDGSEHNLSESDQPFQNNDFSADPTTWNYELKEFSVAVNIGQNTGIDKDYYEQSVPFGGAPDAGIAENLQLTTLPVEFISAQGYSITDGNTIEWEANNDATSRYEVEKSNEGKNFTTIGTVPYKSNGSATTRYQFTDNNVKGDVQYYRIKVTGKGTGNKDTYSKTIAIKNSAPAGNISVYPNPAKDYVYVKMPDNNFQNKEMVLVNMSGVELKRARINEGSSPFRLDVSALPRGAYVIKLIDDKTGQNQTTMFAK
jgi:hypothetical protein